MATALAATALIVALLALTVSLAGAARLRATTSQGAGEGSAASRAPLPEHNRQIEEFTVQRIDGGSFTNADIATRGQLIGFFTSGCSACKDELPHFLASAAHAPADAPRPVAVLSGEDADILAMAEMFPGEIAVVVEHDLALSRSAGIRAYPTFLVADHGTVKSAAVRVDRLFAHH